MQTVSQVPSFFYVTLLPLIFFASVSISLRRCRCCRHTTPTRPHPRATPSSTARAAACDPRRSRGCCGSRCPRAQVRDERACDGKAGSHFLMRATDSRGQPFISYCDKITSPCNYRPLRIIIPCDTLQKTNARNFISLITPMYYCPNVDSSAISCRAVVRVCVADGGYKAFRAWALATLALPRKIRILGGLTGSGKTRVLHELRRRGHQVSGSGCSQRQRGATTPTC